MDTLPLDVILKLRNKDIVIYDLDMTLIDVRGRYYRSLEEIGYQNKRIEDLPPKIRRRFWRIFLSDKYIYLDKPIENTIGELRNKYADGYGILILTGRPLDMEATTKKQLETFNIPYHCLVMRPRKYYTSIVKFKVNVIDLLTTHDFNIIEYHDDDKTVIENIRRNYPWIKAILHKYKNLKIDGIGF